MAALNNLSTFIGQDRVKQGLITLITASRQKENVLQHLLLCAKSGMGKTTLAQITAVEMGAKNKRVIFGRDIEKTGEMAAILTNLQSKELLIIEQIDTVNKQIAEVLASAMKNFTIDLVIGKGTKARFLKLDLQPFTVIGTTSNPLRVDKELSRSMFELDFERYNIDEISRIINTHAKQQQIDISLDAVNLISTYSNECPADALRVLKQVFTYANVHSGGHITPAITKDAITIFNIKTNSTIPERQPISTDVMMLVWQRDQGRCVKCGNQEKLEYDHIIPVSKGGSNTARNIQLLCEHCNRTKSANIE
jgi:Holliday junction DNA helicase RuvB